jgi:Protein of unknown function (DUF1488)
MKSMNIQFIPTYAIETTNGISFPAELDGMRIACHISGEALQDMNPSRAADSPEDQFRANRYLFEEIAERLIRNGRVLHAQLHITHNDLT